MPLLWRSGHLHDRGTEEVLQRHEKTGVQKAAKANSSTTGTVCCFLGVPTFDQVFR